MEHTKEPLNKESTQQVNETDPEIMNDVTMEQQVDDNGHDSDEDVNANLKDIPETFLDLEVWEQIRKNLENFDREDMARLSFKNSTTCTQFYRMYAKVKDFGIRKKNAVKSTYDKRDTSLLIMCNKHGFWDQKHFNRPDRIRKERPVTRCGCNARMSFKWDHRDNSWYIKDFMEEHNHELVPMSQVPFLRSHRDMNDALKIDIKSLLKSGVKPCVTLRNAAQGAGGRRNMGFTDKDFYNAVDKFKKEEIKDGDTETVLAYLLGKKANDPAFFLSYTRDNTNAIEKMLWCDGICQADYKAFGSVIAFDTTYKVNEYKKPFVIIVGVNNHRKTVPLGVALIVNEKTETYIWVLTKFLEANGNVHPYTIVTDGDKAMANAIKCVDGCRTPSEFEEAWAELLTKYPDHEDKKWLVDMYNDKHKWAEAFIVSYFYAGMRSTQRCESMNSTFKTVFTSTIMLYRFVESYDQVLEQIRFEEDRDDYISTHTFPVVSGMLSEIKTQAAQIYARNVYNLFCKELSYESRHIIIEKEESKDHPDGAAVMYWLNDCVKKGCQYVVRHNLALEQMVCCCTKLNSIGIPCRHMFAVMKYEGMVKLPEGCIVRRWTIKAKEHLEDLYKQVRFEKRNDKATSDGRLAFLTSLSIQLCRMVSTSYDRSIWLKDKLAKIILETEKDKKNPKEKDIVIDPNSVRGKGKDKYKKKEGRT